MERAWDLWRRHRTGIVVAVTGVLALICYGFVLYLPFFRDDLPIMSWLSSHSWAEIWTQSSENKFYRPLAFTIYKLGRLLPPGPDRAALHGVSLVIHWVSAGLVMGLVRLRGRPDGEAFLAATLLVVFPLTYMAIPWVTAMSHPLVTVLTLLAVFAALKAEGGGRAYWWGVSLLATSLAPMAHESGHVCGVIVAGVVVIERELGGGRRLAPLVLGVGLNLGALIWRSTVPGVGGASLAGLRDWVCNTVFSLHGLVYPVAPIVGTLVRRFGMQDLLLVMVTAIGLFVVLLVLVLRERDWRWAASGLWWWACGMLPSAVSLRYGYNYASPRVYALAAPGIVMLWAGLIISLVRLTARTRIRLVAVVLLGGVIVTQNVVFLRRQRDLFVMLNNVYRRVLDVAAYEAEPEPAFVNLPASLAYAERTYAMMLETVLFIPRYSEFSEFVAVNGVREADAVVYSPVIKESEYVCGLHGEGLDWEEMRQFAVDHDTVWLARWRDGHLELDYVGDIAASTIATLDDPLVLFEGGAAIESATVQSISSGCWTITIDWMSSGPVDGDVFAHVRDAEGHLVMQADGPALGGLVPPWIWHDGDRVHDVRYVCTEGAAPFVVQVGLFNSDGRYWASLGGVRCPDDVCVVATLGP